MTAVDPTVKFLERKVESLKAKQERVIADRAAAYAKYDKQLAPIEAQVQAHLTALDVVRKSVKPKNDIAGAVRAKLKKEGTAGCSFIQLRDAVQVAFNLTRNEAQGSVYQCLGYMSQQSIIRVSEGKNRRYFLND